MIKKGIFSEELARSILENLGYTIEKMRYKIVKNGNEIGEVDLVVSDPYGEKWAVEIKSGKISISDIRQAYLNAKLTNLKPMIIARGFSNEAAQRLAQELKVKVIMLPDFVLLTLEELSDLLKSTFIEILDELLTPPLSLSNDEINLLKVLVKCKTYEELIEKLKINKRDLSFIFEKLRKKRAFPIKLRGYKAIRIKALISLILYNLLYQGNNRR